MCLPDAPPSFLPPSQHSSLKESSVLTTPTSSPPSLSTEVSLDKITNDHRVAKSRTHIFVLILLFLAQQLSTQLKGNLFLNLFLSHLHDHTLPRFSFHLTGCSFVFSFVCLSSGATRLPQHVGVPQSRACGLPSTLTARCPPAASHCKHYLHTRDNKTFIPGPTSLLSFCLLHLAFSLAAPAAHPRPHCQQTVTAGSSGLLSQHPTHSFPFGKQPLLPTDAGPVSPW